jgi:hypothetical protein
MLYKVKINKLDTKEEKKCKCIFNNNYFGVFNKNYDKFKKYSKLIGLYNSMTYKSENYNYYFIKDNYPEFIEQEEFIIIGCK